MQVSSRHQLLAFYQRDINPEESLGPNRRQRILRDRVWRELPTTRALSSVWTNSLTSRFSVSYNDKSFNRDIDIVRDQSGTGPALSVHQQRTAVSRGADRDRA